MKRILVPTDFSDEALYAAKIAAQFARKFDCEIHLLHMIELPIPQLDAVNSSYSALPEAMFFMKLAGQRFEKLLERDFFEGIKVHDIVKTNSTFEGISSTCKELDIDLIIMGSHGATGFKEMFIGSNAEKVVRTSHIPVLVIKSSDEDFQVNDLVFASDFKLDHKETYKQAIKFAELFDSKIHLLLVNTPNNFLTTNEANNRMNAFVKDTNFKNYTVNIYNDESVEKGILNFAYKINADVIGISTHGRQGIAHFLNGSISEDVVNHAKRPILTFKI
ncbi:universal stress protein [Formosa sp. S-31]|uniref:universal stress protein n=1 Tax=Formosa sp. S-31 TaxID=2790949 RepID=UPI003EBEDB9A